MTAMAKKHNNSRFFPTQILHFLFSELRGLTHNGLNYKKMIIIIITIFSLKKEARGKYNSFQLPENHFREVFQLNKECAKLFSAIRFYATGPD